MDIKEMFGNMEIVKVTKKQFDEMPSLDPDLEMNEQDTEQVSVIRIKTDVGMGDNYMLEVFKKGDRVNANLTVIEIIDDEVDHGKELEKFLDDPSDVGC